MPLNRLDDLYHRVTGNEDGEMSDADLAYASVIRRQADPALSELNLQVDPFEQKKEDALDEIQKRLNIKLEGHEPKPSSTFVSRDANKVEDSYFEQVLLPEAMNIALSGYGPLPGVNDILQIAKDPFGQFQQPVPQVVAEGSTTGGAPSLGMMNITPGQEVEGLSNLAKHGDEFVKNQPITASIMALAAVGGTTSLLGKAGRNLPSFLPNDPKKFFSKDVPNVLGGKTRFASVYLDSRSKNYKKAYSELRQLYDAAEEQGLVVRAVRSQSKDRPGINAAIFNAKALNHALKGLQDPSSSRDFVNSMLAEPGRTKSKYYEAVIQPMRDGNEVIVPKAPNRLIGETLRSPHRIMQKLHPDAAPIFRAGTSSVIEGRMVAEAGMQLKEQLYQPIRRKYGNEYLGQALADINRKVRGFRGGKKVEGEFADPLAYRSTLVSQYPEDVQAALSKHYELTDFFKGKVRQELKAQNLPDKLIESMVDDDAYFTRLFQGNFQIFGKRGKDMKAEFIDRAETLPEAVAKMQDMKKRGFVDMTYAYDNIIPGEIAARIPRKQYERVLAAIKNKTGEDRRQVLDWLKMQTSFSEQELSTLLPADTKKKSARFNKSREINPVTGEEFDFVQFDYDKVMDAYIQSTSRWLAVNRFEREFQRNKAKIPRSMTRLNSYLDDYRNDVWGRRYKSSQSFDEAIQKILPGVKPMALERLMGHWLNFRSQVALGTPAAAVTNMYQTFQTLWPRVPTKTFFRAWKEARNPDVIERAKRDGVLGLPTKIEDVHLGKKGLESQRNLLYVHGKTEQQNKLVAYRAGELAADTPEGRWVAERLGMNPNDPEFVRKYAIDMAQQTQFDMSKADMPFAFRGPLAKVMFQFKPFSAKYVESLAALRDLPNPGKAYAKAVTAQLIGGGLRTVTNPVKFATTVGVLESYKEIREWASDKFGEEEGEAIANGVIYGLPGFLGADMTQRLNVELFPSFGRTPKEKAVNYLTGPTVSDIFNAVEFIGLKKQDKEAVYAYLRRMFPQVGIGQSLWQVIRNDKWIRDSRGKKLGQADPVERFLEALSFNTIKRRHALDTRFELNDPGVVSRGLGIVSEKEVPPLRGTLKRYSNTK